VVPMLDVAVDILQFIFFFSFFFFLCCFFSDCVFVMRFGSIVFCFVFHIVHMHVSILYLDYTSSSSVISIRTVLAVFQ
jgi:hypothetical protein